MSEVVTVHGAEPGMLDVVFVHGLDGDARSTWRGEDGSSFWPAWLAEDIAGVSVWSLGYDGWSSRWRGRALPIQDRAINLLAQLQNAGVGERPICWVSHSMGGLLIKQMLLHAAHEPTGYSLFASRTRGVVFLSTPHTGSGLTTAVRALRTIYRPSVAIDDLERNSAHLRDLNDRYRDWVAATGIPHLVFFETRPTKGLQVVDSASANPGLATVRPIAVETNHIDICKPADRKSLVYGQVKRFIDGCLAEPVAGRGDDDSDRRRGYVVAGELGSVRPERAAAAGTPAQAVSGVDIVAPMEIPARSRYRNEQVRRIAPRELFDRETELSAQREFCTAGDVEVPYQWWRADAWSGKSALAASFVLDPPPGVQIVSFFITARLAGHDTRATFAQIVLEQLAELLGRPMPTVGEANRDLELSGMLREAALACSQRGGRLVLVVDGLDEDSGVGGSIAALLPVDPPTGLRVVVTSRPNPELPADVSDDHPLRDSLAVRTLVTAPAARIARTAMERELDALLEGSAQERDLVGLLVAARGGLSGPDLADLTGLSPRRLDKLLNGPSGRSFGRRAADWRAETTPELYLLAHENLQRAAEEELGENALRRYRERLHEWAERYRLAGWPPETPQFLLRGGFRLLDAATKALYAADPARHDRLLAVSGGDTAALEEINEARGAMAGTGLWDMSTTMRLAMHRETLSDRNADTPTRLPAVLVSLGDLDRAEALAIAITNDRRRQAAIAHVIDALVRRGQHERARNLIRRIPQRDDQHEAIVALAGVLAAEGEIDLADTVAASATDPRVRAWAVAGILERANLDLPQALALAAPHAGYMLVQGALVPAIGCGGDLTAAVNLARRIRERLVGVYALADLTHSLAHHGDFAAAETVVKMADAELRIQATKTLIEAAAAAGHFDRACILLRDLVRPEDRDHAKAALAVGLIAARQFPAANAVLDSIRDKVARQLTLEELINAVDDVVWLRAFTDLLPEDTAWRHDRAKAANALVRVMCRAGELIEAERVVQQVADQGEAYVVLAETAIALGAGDRGRDYVARAEAAARRSGHSSSRSKVLKALAAAVVEVRDVVRAETLARHIGDPAADHEIAAILAPFLSEAGDLSLATSFALAARQPSTRLTLLIPIVRRLWQAGNRRQARDIANQACVTMGNEPSSDLVPLLVDVVASSGQADRAIELARDSDRLWSTVPILVTALGVVGDLSGVATAVELFSASPDIGMALERLAGAIGAEAVYPLLEKISSEPSRAAAMVTIAKHAKPDLRKRLLGEAVELAHWTEPLRVFTRDDPEAAMAIVDEYVERWLPGS